jgi:thiol:disulfide interchange protein DsbC
MVAAIYSLLVYLQGIIMRNYMIIGALLAISSSILSAEPSATVANTALPPAETPAMATDTSPAPDKSNPTTPETTSATTEESTAKTTPAAKPATTTDDKSTESTAKTTPAVTPDAAKPATTTDDKSTAKPESTQTISESKPATTTTATPSSKLVPEAVTQALKRIIKVDFDKVSITESALKGLYEVLIGSEIVYVSDDGHYLVVGDIRDMKTGQNLTDDKRAQLRVKELDALDEKEMIVFAPEKETKYTVNVFTDVDCPYCAKFHTEVPELNKGGVKVRYLAFPRAGIGSKTYKTMVSVWCAEDRQQAITDAKAKKEVKSATCNNPVDKEYELGKRLGVSGTPAMLLPNGELVPGYVPAKQLIAFLERKSKPQSQPAMDK